VLGAMNAVRRHASAGFTLIELLVGVAIIGVLIALVAPSFRDMMDMQRLRGTSAQVVTDVQYARSEATSRQEAVALTFGSSLVMTCYIVHTCARNAAGVPEGPSTCTCDCTQPDTARCNNGRKELRTVQVRRDSKIEVVPVRNPPAPAVNFILFDPVTGGMQAYNVGVGNFSFPELGSAWSETSLVRNSAKTLRTMVSVGGRPSVCTPAGKLVSGATLCQ